jgi:two-component system chemotaxis response regulator CheB
VGDTIKILIVDDDVISRKLLRTVLEKESDIEIAGLSCDGESALMKIPLSKPDLVTLDIEMPGMGGLEALRQIRASYPHLPVIMYSSHTEDGASVTLEALAAGASDYVTKPEGRTIDGFPLDQLRHDLLPKVRALCSSNDKAQRTPERTVRGAELQKGHIDVVAIGVSTGGPSALAQIIPFIDGDLPVPILIVQHMPPTFTRLLAERLDANTALEVVEASGGELVQAGKIYLAPGNYHMSVTRKLGENRITLDQNEKINSCRPAVDVLFNSVAKVYGGNTLAVVLTGMGSDGARGCETIERAGGSVLIQSEETSVVWGMPGAVANSGVPHTELPLNKIANKINCRVSNAGQSAGWQAKSA